MSLTYHEHTNVIPIRKRRRRNDTMPSDNAWADMAGFALLIWIAFLLAILFDMFGRLKGGGLG